MLAGTRELWESLRQERVFITGGTGFFGTWLLESFAWANRELNLGSEAVVLSRNPGAFLSRFHHLKEGGIHFHQGDIESFEFPEGEFSHVIHAATAASANLNEESPLVMFDNVVRGTRRALDFARARGVKKVLFTSSGAVYGKQPSAMTHVAEDFTGGPDPLDLRSAYAESKRAAELLCASYSRAYGFEAKIARCFAFVGPHLPLDIHFAIGNFIRDGLAGREIQIGGDGTPFRSYLYASELMEWLLTILVRGQSCRPYNVGSDDGRSIAQIAEAVNVEFGNKPGVRIAKKADTEKAPDRYVPSVARARVELGLMQKVSLEESIRRTIRFHRGKGK